MFTEQELSKLIQDVEKEFSTYLAKSEETTLVKSEAPDGKKKDKKKDEKPEAKETEEASEPNDHEAPPQEGEQDEAAEGEHDEAAEGEHDEAAEAHGEEAAEAPPVADEGAEHGYDEEDMAHMEAMYKSMSRAELIAHHDCIKRALDEKGAEKCGDMSGEVPGQNAPMAKSEETAVEVKPEVLVASAETELLKSELTAKDGQIAELKKSVEVMTTFINKLFEKKSAPQGKAITQLEQIQKSETPVADKTFTKAEIAKILTEKASDPNLKKADRVAINEFYASGQININGISHLLK